MNNYYPSESYYVVGDLTHSPTHRVITIYGIETKQQAKLHAELISELCHTIYIHWYYKQTPHKPAITKKTKYKG